jgi:16S rRNA (guanine527-N7)-methyltransferase
MPPLSEAGLRLARQASFLSPPLDAVQLERLDAYLDLVLRWNRRIRLVGPRDPTTLVDEHLIDCLQVAHALSSVISPMDGRGDLPAAHRQQLVDVGSGAGLPGVVIAIAIPGLAVTLCEPSEKRCAFLHEAHRVLGASFTVCEQPVESLIAVRPMGFDHAICRATFEPEAWATLGASLVRSGGSLWFMLAQRQIVLSVGASSYPYELPGGKLRTVARWKVTAVSSELPRFT